MIFLAQNLDCLTDYMPMDIKDTKSAIKNYQPLENIPAITGDTYMICDAVTGNSITIAVDELMKLQFMLKILGK